MISINFASRNYRLTAMVTKGLFIGSVILTLTASGMLWTSATLRHSSAIMEERLKEAEAADIAVKPLLAERARVVKDLSAMSGLLESRRFSWTKFLSSLELAVPRGVAMKRIDFNSRDSVLSLEGTAQSPEALRNLIVGLERSVSFREALLKHQSQEKGSISFNVVAIYDANKNAAAVH
jgi:Tfp pilus assembly protein PilN